MDMYEDQPMEDAMDATMDAAPPPTAPTTHQPQNTSSNSATLAVLTEMDHLYAQMRAAVAGSSSGREPFRDIQVKVHIRRPDRDSWAYMGRGIVSQEIHGQSSRVVVRSVNSHKVLTAFGEGAALQAEKRGNFVVIGCVEDGRVVSWSLNAMNNSETLRLLASIELACYACKLAVADPQVHTVHRRRIARVIKDDRRRRHKRRKDQDSMVAAFARTGLGGEQDVPPSNVSGPAHGSSASPPAPPPTEPVFVPSPVPMPIPEPVPGPANPGFVGGFGAESGNSLGMTMYS